MRKGLLIAAVLAASAIQASPAAAQQVYDVSIVANLTGTNSFASCTNGEVFPNCPLEVNPYQGTLSEGIGHMTLTQGENYFTFGNYYGTGSIQGYINNDNGYLTGNNLSYQYAACSGSCPGSHIQASAATFEVIGGVPEPKTWAMMLLGFGAIGFAIRRKRAETLVAA